MTEDLHEIFEQRLKGGILSHLKYYATGDDLTQEGMLGMWKSLKKDPKCKDRFIKNNIRWSIFQSLKKGKSVDAKKMKKERQRPIEIIRTDAVAEEVSEYILEDNWTLPVDEKVIGKMAFERFVDSLNNLEKRFVLSKLREELRDKLYKELGQYKFMATYRACRDKFRAAFEC